MLGSDGLKFVRQFLKRYGQRHATLPGQLHGWRWPAARHSPRCDATVPVCALAAGACALLLLCGRELEGGERFLDSGLSLKKRELRQHAAA